MGLPDDARHLRSDLNAIQPSGTDSIVLGTKTLYMKESKEVEFATL